MYFSEIKECDIANGPGVRVTVFVSGCTHHCNGCFNEMTWDFQYGREFTKEDMEKIEVEKIDRLEEGLKRADFVTLHVPLTKETHCMMSAEQFRSMKDSAYIINMGRGPVIDEEALVQALENNEIAGAGLDVLSVEPPRADHPLFSMDQVIFTPHIGGDTREAKMRTSELLSKSIIDVLDGQEVYNWVNKF